jgi:hypothetical protein
MDQRDLLLVAVAVVAVEIGEEDAGRDAADAAEEGWIEYLATEGPAGCGAADEGAGFRARYDLEQHLCR